MSGRPAGQDGGIPKIKVNPTLFFDLMDPPPLYVRLLRHLKLCFLSRPDTNETYVPCEIADRNVSPGKLNVNALHGLHPHLPGYRDLPDRR